MPVVTDLGTGNYTYTPTAILSEGYLVSGSGITDTYVTVTNPTYRGYVGTATQGTNTIYESNATGGTPIGGTITNYVNAGTTDYGAAIYSGTAVTTGSWIIEGYQGTAGFITAGNGYINAYTAEPFNVFGSIPIEGDKKTKHRAKVAFNLAPKTNTRENLFKADAREQIALETLREVITETEFRKYLKYGFVLVKGKSGDTYQIFRNRSHTKVYRGAKLIEEVCVRIKHEQNVPPTDNVIAFMTMLRGDEQEFKKLGNVYKYAA